MVTDKIESYRDNARRTTRYRLKSSDPNVPEFHLEVDDFMEHQMKAYADYPSPEDQLWMKRKTWEIDNKVWKDKQVAAGIQDIYGVTYPQYYATSAGSTAGPVTIQYDNSTQAYPTITMPVQFAPPPEPKELTPLEWLDSEVEQVREMAWAI